MKITTAQKMREMDARAIQEYKIPGVVLMENAGLRVVEEIKRMYSPESLRAVILCGRGNNGGDGFVIARHLINQGSQVTVYAMARQEGYRGDALINFCILNHMQAEIKHILKEEDLALLEADLSSAHLVVDALLGTGLDSEVRGIMAQVINRVNDTDCPVIAVDIPSGIQADTGEVMGCAVRAAKTVTLALPKQGLFLYPGAEYAGEVSTGDISMPREIMEDPEVTVNLTTRDFVVNSLAERPAYSHKGTYGRILIVGGSPGLTGAVAMAGEAALRSGSGLITAGVPSGLNSILEVKLTEVMTLPLPETEAGGISSQALEPVLSGLKQCKAAGFGPGVLPDRQARIFLEGLIRKTPVPLVIDAGGLTLLAENMEILKEAADSVVLTPHPGEMARMLKTSADEVEKNRLEAAVAFARNWKVTLVLKGANTITALPSGEAYINTTGNAGMASGGTGDVLTGIIVSLIGQGAAPEEAAVSGVYIHGLAGNLAAEYRGEAGLAATDLVDCLPLVLKEM